MTDRFISVTKIESCFSEFIEAMENRREFWQPATVGHKQYSQHRSSYVFPLIEFFQSDPDRVDPVSRAFSSIIKIVDPLIVEYRERFEIPLRFDNGWAVNRYSPGAYYKTHWDWHPAEPRTVSVVVMSNTVEDGGDLYFPRQDFRVPAEEGLVVVFPSCFAYEHSSMPVKKGVKYSMVTWLG